MLDGGKSVFWLTIYQCLERDGGAAITKTNKSKRKRGFRVVDDPPRILTGQFPVPQE